MKKSLLSAFIIAFTLNIATSKTPVDGIIESVRSEYAPDKRVSVYEVEATRQNDGKIRITGKISDPRAYDALSERIKSRKFAPIDNRVKLLPQSDFGLVSVSVASMRSAPKYSSELSTQTLLGMPVRIIEKNGGWWRVQSVDDYIGWVWHASIAEKSAEEMNQWRGKSRLVVTSRYETQAFDSPDSESPRHRITDLVPGNIVEGDLGDIINGKTRIILPDGRTAWADASSFTPIKEWGEQVFDPQLILDTAYSMEGAPYLWGGTSPKATDCSGLVKVAYFANGYILSRDASQQAKTGTPLNADEWRQYKPGDLLFFGERPGGRVTHVAIYDHNGNFIHCAGRVHRSSLDPTSDVYTSRLFFGGVRVEGNEDTPGIRLARNHPWIF